MFAKMIAPCSGQACTAQEVPFATDTMNVAVLRAQRHTRGVFYTVQNDGQALFVVIEKDGMRWVLDRPGEAGPCGVTPIDELGPSWSAHMFHLSVQHLNVETECELQADGHLAADGRYDLHFFLQQEGQTTWLKKLCLRCLQGLTEAQAQALAALLCEVSND